MNSVVARALLEDAWRQVLDNKVFRLLAALVIVPVLTTFLIGFKEDGIEVLHGVWGFQYDDVLWMFGGRIGGVDAKTLAIQSYQAVVVQWLAGFFGLVFCIAATAFFVPRMMEKGAADMLFSKPVSRFALLVSRYVSGLLFVGVLAVVLVFGMYLGFSLVSGYSDTGFLWAAITLVYLYALMHAFSLAVATVTRSSVAALLVTLALFLFSGCIHQGWIAKEVFLASNIATKVDELTADEAREGPPPTEAEARALIEADRPAAVGVVMTILDVLHFVLPKTADAAIITEKLKDAVVNDPFLWRDEVGGLRVQNHPSDFELVESADAQAESPVLVWNYTGETGQGRITLSRRPLRDADGKRMTASRLSSLLVSEVELLSDLPKPPAREFEEFAGRSSPTVAWEHAGQRHGAVFVNAGEFVYELRAEVDVDALSEEDFIRTVRRFVRGWFIGNADPRLGQEWVSEQYGWDAPLRYNLWFSIASSLAFALAMMAIAGWKLSRVDF